MPPHATRVRIAVRAALADAHRHLAIGDPTDDYLCARSEASVTVSLTDHGGETVMVLPARSDRS